MSIKDHDYKSSAEEITRTVVDKLSTRGLSEPEKTVALYASALRMLVAAHAPLACSDDALKKQLDLIPDAVMTMIVEIRESGVTSAKIH